MDMEKAVGAELKACRLKKQISQEQLGFDAGVHRTYVSLIERGAKSPTLGVLFRLCKALDVPPAKFVKNVQLHMEENGK
jgi:transcriptional regulator with XRE-family HTH domain